MRPVYHGDVAHAARALLVVPERARQAFCRQLIRGANAADAFARRTGALHPVWGDGSLMAAAHQCPRAREPSFDNPDYCACFAMVLLAVRADRLAVARRG